MHPDGFLPDGRPYFDLTGQLAGLPLGPGESTQSREIKFLNNSGERFQYELRTLGKLNAAPAAFETIPLADIEAGRTYRYQAKAVDPDDQSVSYTVVVGPESLTIDETTGEIVWPTTPADVGVHNVVLRATDPFGLYVEQAFHINVLESLQNRPPVFVSTPETEAIAASGFEVTTLATGSL